MWGPSHEKKGARASYVVLLQLACSICTDSPYWSFHLYILVGQSTEQSNLGYLFLVYLPLLSPTSICIIPYHLLWLASHVHLNTISVDLRGFASHFFDILVRRVHLIWTTYYYSSCLEYHLAFKCRYRFM